MKIIRKKLMSFMMTKQQDVGQVFVGRMNILQNVHTICVVK